MAQPIMWMAVRRCRPLMQIISRRVDCWKSLWLELPSRSCNYQAPACNDQRQQGMVYLGCLSPMLTPRSNCITACVTTISRQVDSWKGALWSSSSLKLQRSPNASQHRGCFSVNLTSMSQDRIMSQAAAQLPSSHHVSVLFNTLVEFCRGLLSCKSRER